MYIIIFIFFLILLISNDTVFSFNLGLTYAREFFKNLKLHSPKRLVLFEILKNTLMQMNPKLNSKSYDYIY